jgi:hypothetical protein
MPGKSEKEKERKRAFPILGCETDLHTTIEIRVTFVPVPISTVTEKENRRNVH